MKMSISSKERDLLIGFFGVIIAVLVWFLVASPTMEKTDVLKNENIILKQQAEEYETIHMRVGEYSDAIVINSVESDEIIDHYPGVIETEDQLMYWANIGNSYPNEMFFKDIEIQTRVPVAVSVPGTEEDTAEVVENSQVESIISKYTLYEAPMSMEFSCTYAGMKDIFNYISKQYNKNSIVNVDVSYDESTGLLEGNIGVDLYYINGLDKLYTPVFIPAVPKGQIDVFHTGASTMDAYLNAVGIDAETVTQENAE